MINSYLRNLRWRKLIIERLKKQSEPKSILNWFVDLLVELWFDWTCFSLNVFHKRTFNFRVLDVHKTSWLTLLFCFHSIVYSWHPFLSFFYFIFVHIFYFIQWQFCKYFECRILFDWWTWMHLISELWLEIWIFETYLSLILGYVLTKWIWGKTLKLSIHTMRPLG